MNYGLIIKIFLLFIGLLSIGILSYLYFISQKSPSIIGGGYDKKEKKYSEESKVDSTVYKKGE